MKQSTTHITVILDRTGSMDSIRDDTIGGFNHFLEQQQAEPGKATLTLVQFDSQDPYEVIHHFVPIKKVPKLTRETYVPRATTPLLDAIGRGINDLESSLAAKKKNNKDTKVVMVVITDGYENASCEFKRSQIEKMIKTKQKKDNWQFVYLSADLSSINDALDHGFDRDAVMAFDKDAQGTDEAWRATSARIADYRAARIEKMAYCPEDRSKQKLEKARGE